jgi:hypothetical protein
MGGILRPHPRQPHHGCLNHGQTKIHCRTFGGGFAKPPLVSEHFFIRKADAKLVRYEISHDRGGILACKMKLCKKFQAYISDIINGGPHPLKECFAALFRYAENLFGRARFLVHALVLYQSVFFQSREKGVNVAITERPYFSQTVTQFTAEVVTVRRRAPQDP